MNEIIGVTFAELNWIELICYLTLVMQVFVGNLMILIVSAYLCTNSLITPSRRHFMGGFLVAFECWKHQG